METVKSRKRVQSWGGGGKCDEQKKKSIKTLVYGLLRNCVEKT